MYYKIAFSECFVDQLVHQCKSLEIIKVIGSDSSLTDTGPGHSLDVSQ